MYSKKDQLPEPKKKRTQINKEVNKRLKEIYADKGITRCEICDSDFGLSFHHRHKRREYYGQEEKLSDFNQTLLVCPDHHELLEYDRKLNELIFNVLRG